LAGEQQSAMRRKAKRKMLNDQDDPKSKALVVTNDDDLSLIGDAAQSLAGSDMVGEPLRFKQGIWRKKTGSTGDKLKDYTVVKQLEQFVVDVLSYKHGWIRWHEKKPTHKFMGRKVDRWPLPKREQLPEADIAYTEEDGWQETHTIVMRELESGALFTYGTTSWGGKKALSKLLGTFKDNAKKHPGMMPVVYLGSVDRMGEKGEYQAPTLEVCEWAEFGEDQSPPGNPPETPPALPRLTDQSETVVESSSMADDMDDEIPDKF
jgi:hypothetical protein